MKSLADKAILSGADNRPPMLENDMYDSWKSRMELYMLNRQHGWMIIESVKNCPLLWPTVEENGVTRLKKYSKLSTTEAIQDNCDVKATNIILQGLHPEVYAFVSTLKVAKELWERIQMLMQGTSLTKQERECKLYDEFDKFAYMKGESLQDFYLRFSLHLNDMNIYNMKLEQFQGRQNSMTDGSSRPYTSGSSGTLEKQRVIVCYNCKGEGHMSKQCTKPKRKRDEEWFKDKVLLVQAQANGQVLLEEELEFLANPGIAETSNVQATSTSEQSNILNHSETEITSGSNIISYSHYMNESQYTTGQNLSSPALQDDLVLSMIEQLKTQVVTCTKTNQDNKNANEMLTAELERYKNQSELSAEQAFWSRYLVNFEEPDLSSSTTIVEVPKELPKVSMVNSSLKKIKFHLASFDMVVKERTTSTTITEGTWGFKQTKACFRTAHTDYLRHTQEKTTTLREIVESERLLIPLNTSLDYACKYTKRIQELLIILQQTCPCINDLGTKLMVVTPKNNDQQIRLTKHIPSSGNTPVKTTSSTNVVFNTHVLSSTGVNLLSSASGPQPQGNIKKDRIQRAPSKAKKNKTIDTTIDQQVVMDEALVPHAQRLRIGKSIFRLLSDIKSKESTLQLVYDVLRICPFFKAFLVTVDVPKIYMQEFWATATVHHHAIRFKMDNKKHIVNLESFRDMLLICPRPWRSFATIINKCLTGKSSGYDSLRLSQAQILWGLYHKRNIDYAYLMWKDFVYQVEHKNSKKSNEMYYLRFTKVIIHHFMSKDPSIPRRNKFGALLPIELTNEEIRNSNPYKEYYKVATGVTPPKPKACVWKTRSSSDTTVTPPTAAAGPRLTTSTKGKQVAKATKAKSISSLSEVAMTEAQLLKLATKRSLQQTHISQASVSGDDNEGKDDGGDEEDDGDDGKERDGDDDDDDDDEDNDGEEGDDDDDDDQEVIKDDDKEDEKDDEEEGGDDVQEYTEEEYDEETRNEESFDPISKTLENSNDEGDGEEDLRLNVGREEGHVKEEEEDELYKDVNINQGRGIQATLEVEDSHVTLTLVNPDERHVEEEEEDELYRDVNINQGRGIQGTLEVKDSHVTLTPVNPDGQQQSSSVSSQFVTSMLNSTLDVGMESIFETTSQMDVQTPTSMAPLPMSAPTMTPSTIATITTTSQAPILQTIALSTIIQDLPNFSLLFGFDNRLRTLEANSSLFMQTNQFAGAVSAIPGITSYAVVADLSEMELKKILIKKMEGKKSIQRSDEQRNLYKSLVEAYESNKIILDTYRETVTLKRRRDNDADKDEEPSVGPDRGSKRRKEGKEPESASAPKEKATRSTGMSSQRSKSRQASASESALADEPMHTTFQMEEPSHLEFDIGRRVIPFNHFINNDLEYLRGGASSCKYTTSITKTKAADYGHIKWIEYLVPITMWIEEPIGYDKHALWGVSYWGRKHQQFYGFAVNWESARDIDGMLIDVRTALDDRLKGIRMRYLPQTIWRKSDKDKAAAMIQVIDKRLKTRRIMRSLEKFFGGRLYEGDFRMLQRII
nr:hypothetical protein [Tanacetum cinerariifolium]